jgi:glycosyltransferase involved in cell wall biosynthesis
MIPLLSISIPTYNRVSMLKSTLPLLMSQIDRHGLHEEVEIVISDNCSIDGTEDYLKSLLALNKYRLVYNRNSENQGVIKNILKLVECSSGKYWMFYGDDDVVPEGALLALLENFKEHANYPAYMFKWKEDNFCSHLEDGKEITFSELGNDFFYYIGNAGIFAVDTNYAQQVVEKYKEELCATCWPQTLIVFMSMHFANKPMLFRTIISSETPEVAVIRSNGYYLFETALYALLRTAISIEDIIAVPFVATAKNSIDGIKHFPNHKETILENYLYFDSEKQKKDFVDSVKEAHQRIPLEHRYEIDAYYSIVTSSKALHVVKLYIIYFKASLRRKIETNFINKLKIYSPYGYYKSIIQTKKKLAGLKIELKREEVSAGSGYF